ncbi:B12-binding domain-containing radical SAM protein [Ketobacter sp.]|uniref:B12-binding domain-containing radical SAM protein n=1 Tax=Ketobacter sp. TaxID=2083498 RepID=UPI0025BFCC0F|nr:radical SAM protein [Ketobacter sp.]
MAHQGKVLLVDLNAFSSFPTLAIGLVTAALRRDGYAVQVICPLDHGRPTAVRERRERLTDHFMRRLHLSAYQPILPLRDLARRARAFVRDKPDRVTIDRIRSAIESRPSVILLSAYLMHFEVVRKIAAIAQQQDIPVVVGGPMFNIAATAEHWRKLPGVTALVGAESDLSIPHIVRTVVEKGDLLQFPGVTLPDGRISVAAEPLRPLDSTPFADFTDFPWERYPVRIVPIMTGRGCQWAKCAFCSDVVSANGLSYRSRSIGHVLAEMEEQARRHATRNFLFLDLKLNSWPDMLRAIAEQLPQRVPGAEWIGTVHVDTRADNGLSFRDLKAAVSGGMRRVSFGLESGSQRLLDSMNKGSTVEGNSEFIRNAHRAGLSLRCTMFAGYPGETEEDMAATADFLEAHEQQLDRVRFNAFSVLDETPIFKRVAEQSEALILTDLRPDPQRAKMEYRNRTIETKGYRKHKHRALASVYRINKRSVRSSARQFDGLM